MYRKSFIRKLLKVEGAKAHFGIWCYEREEGDGEERMKSLLLNSKAAGDGANTEIRL
jgi:hypothetical protein